jgi:DNA polymerase III subunit epsilon
MFALQQAIELIKGSADYRLIERYKKPLYYHEDDGSPKYKGLFLDVESTGLCIPQDRIIELGMVLFEYSADGRIFKILKELSQYQDPGKAIPAEIVELTGITDEMVQGQHLDKVAFFECFKEADLIIAHCASFDRVALEAQWSDLPIKPWACSMLEVPWRKEGIESVKLEYLAYRYGFFYEGHRATIDCLAGIHLLSQVLPRSGARVLRTLLVHSQQRTYRIWAFQASIEKKDDLKKRGYRWDPSGQGKYRAWSIELPEEQVLAELGFLWEKIYANTRAVPIEVIEASSRFSRTAVLPECWIEGITQMQTLIDKLNEDVGII